MDEQKERGQDYQGIERQYCREDILIALLDGNFGFNEIVKRFEHSIEKTKQGKRTYSRGTVYKYLRDLVEDKKVQYSDSELEYGKLRRPYTLTIDGKKEAENLLPLNIIRSWSNEQLSQFIVNYKLSIINNIVEYFGVKAYKNKLIDKPNLRRLLSLERVDEGAKSSIAIDNDLKGHGFTYDEIINLWLMYNGEDIKRILENLGGGHFFERMPFKPETNLTDKQKEEEKTRIRERIMLYMIQHKIAEVNKIIDLTPFESILRDLLEDDKTTEDEGRIMDSLTKE
jgi:DNA-binding PadR family transcriptional regulator